MPSRKATSLRLSGTSSLIYFNSRPHRGRQLKSGAGWICIDISTHALTEGDGNPGSAEQQTSHFNSRPHGGRPLQTRLHLRCVFHFNSRPHGGRHLTRMIRRFQCTFQLTPSRRATEQVPFGVYAVEFQLTPSRRATKRYHRIPSFSEHFNSRPHGGRRFRLCRMHLQTYFNSRPHGGRLEIVRSLG